MWRKGTTLAVVVSFVVAVEWVVGWGDVLSPWSEKSASFIVTVTGLLALSYLARAVRLHRYFSVPNSFARCLRVFLQHNMLLNLLPMRSGEVVFPVLMRHHFSMPARQSLAGLMWLRLLDLHALLLLLALAIALVSPVPVGAVIIAVVLAPLLAVRMCTRASASWLERRGGRVCDVLREALRAVPDSRRLLMEQWAWTMLAWTIKLVAHGLILAAFASSATVPAVIGAIGGELSSVLPIHGPASLGTYESGVVAAMAVVNVPLRQALHGAVNLHLVVLCVSILSGLATFLMPQRTSRALTE